MWIVQICKWAGISNFQSYWNKPIHSIALDSTELGSFKTESIKCLTILIEKIVWHQNILAISLDWLRAHHPDVYFFLFLYRYVRHIWHAQRLSISSCLIRLTRFVFSASTKCFVPWNPISFQRRQTVPSELTYLTSRAFAKATALPFRRAYFSLTRIWIV